MIAIAWFKREGSLGGTKSPLIAVREAIGLDRPIGERWLDRATILVPTVVLEWAKPIKHHPVSRFERERLNVRARIVRARIVSTLVLAMMVLKHVGVRPNGG